MKIDELVYFAENKLLKVLRDCGFKYLHKDFADRNTVNFNKVIQTTVYANNDIYFHVLFDDEQNPDRGRELKKDNEKFLSFGNVKVDSEGVIFEYSYKELEAEYGKMKGTGDKSIKKNVEKKTEVYDDNERVISNEDLEKIKSIASSYNMSITDLGKMLCRKKMSFPKLQITCNEEEFELIKARAENKDLSMSKYCLKAIQKIIEDDKIGKLSFAEIYNDFLKAKKKLIHI